MEKWREALVSVIVNTAKERGISVTELSNRSGVSYHTVKKLMESTEECNPNAVTLNKLAFAMGLRTSDLLKTLENESTY